MLTRTELTEKLSDGFRSTYLESYSTPHLNHIYQLKLNGVDTQLFTKTYLPYFITFLERGLKLEQFPYFKNEKNITNTCMEQLIILHDKNLSTDMFMKDGVTYPDDIIKLLVREQFKGNYLWNNYDYSLPEEELKNLISWDSVGSESDLIPKEYRSKLNARNTEHIKSFLKYSNDLDFYIKFKTDRQIILYAKMCSDHNLNMYKFSKILQQCHSDNQLATNLGTLIIQRKIKHKYESYDDFISKHYGSTFERVKEHIKNVAGNISYVALLAITECVAKGLPLENFTEGAFELLKRIGCDYYTGLVYMANNIDLHIIAKFNYTREEEQNLFKELKNELNTYICNINSQYIWVYLDSLKYTI